MNDLADDGVEAMYENRECTFVPSLRIYESQELIIVTRSMALLLREEVQHCRNSSGGSFDITSSFVIGTYKKEFEEREG